MTDGDASRNKRLEYVRASNEIKTRKEDFMQSLAQQFSELRTAALVSGKITAAQINEATQGMTSEEQRLSKLKEMTKACGVTVQSAESYYSEKADNLIEQIGKSGKVKDFQIIEATKDCATEKDRFEALQSLALAKQIGTKQIVRNNGGRIAESSVDLTESERTAQRVKQYQKKFKVSEKEACAMIGLPYLTESVQALSESTGDKNTPRLANRLAKLRKMGFNEADAKKVIEQGLW
jgi:hypothetical protein